MQAFSRANFAVLVSHAEEWNGFESCSVQEGRLPTPPRTWIHVVCKKFFPSASTRPTMSQSLLWKDRKRTSWFFCVRLWLPKGAGWLTCMYILCQDQALASGISKHVAMDSDRGGLHSDLPICNTKPPICQILGGYCARFNTWLENVSFSLRGGSKLHKLRNISLHLCPGSTHTSHHHRATLEAQQMLMPQQPLSPSMAPSRCCIIGSLQISKAWSFISRKREQNWVITATSPKTLYITVNSKGFLWTSCGILLPIKTVTKELHQVHAKPRWKKHLHLRTGLRACVTVFLSVSWTNKLTSPTLQNISELYIYMYVYL